MLMLESVKAKGMFSLLEQCRKILIMGVYLLLYLQSSINNPFRYVREYVAKVVQSELRRLGFDVDFSDVYSTLEIPPDESLGDLAFPVFKIAKKFKQNPLTLASTVTSNIQQCKHVLVKRVKAVKGYVNFFINTAELAKILFESIRSLGENYGFVKVEKPLRIVVEHTSANPVHPLHIGHCRNAIIGDTLARLLKLRGHKVETRFYINDMGRQVATLVYGYTVLGKPKPKGKPDHYLGLIYAITNTIIEIDRLKSEIEKCKKSNEYEKVREKLRELDELISVASELRSRDRELFDKLAEKLKGRDHESEISRLMREYEFRESKETVETFREVCSLVIQGFKETLSKLGITFDKWDWESDIAWSGLVRKLIDLAKSRNLITLYKGALALNLKDVQEDPDVREKLKLPSFNIPPLILMRSDGTTLYTTRDVAYSLVKFENADKVINVIMNEQRLEQLQVRLALAALGYRRQAYNQIHYVYEIVKLPGFKMSGRKGRYITMDEAIEEAIVRARVEVDKRNPTLPARVREEIAKSVGLGALRYAMISVSATKPMIFEWDRVLSLEVNSGPYIQYAHARAVNILQKYGKPVDYDRIDYSAAEETQRRRRLVKLLSQMPEVFSRAADELKPEYIVEYLGKVAEEFNAFYTEDPVIGEPDEGKRNFKLALVEATRIVLRNSLNALGITAPERM